MNHEISLQTAIQMTTDFRANQPAGMARCETFDRQAIDRLLSIVGCVKIRIYYGTKEGEVHAILVAADAANHDLLPSAQSGTSVGDDDPVIINDTYRCPPHCPDDSPLNP